MRQRWVQLSHRLRIALRGGCLDKGIDIEPDVDVEIPRNFSPSTIKRRSQLLTRRSLFEIRKERERDIVARDRGGSNEARGRQYGHLGVAEGSNGEGFAPHDGAFSGLTGRSRWLYPPDAGGRRGPYDASMLFLEDSSMRNLISAFGFATLLVLTACAAPGSGRSTSFLPQSAAPISEAAEPDAQSALIETQLNAGGGNFLAPDQLGNVWFGLTSPLALATIGEQTLHVHQYALPNEFAEPSGMALSPVHDAMWFTDIVTNSIGSIGLSSHAITRFKIPTANSFPISIAAGPDNAMWFTEFRGGNIGRIDLATHAIKEFPGADGPWGITKGPGTAMWFSAFHSIGRIKNGHIDLYSVNGNKPFGITSGPDGGVWFTGESDHNGSMFGRIDPSTFARKVDKYAAGSKGNQDLVFRGSSIYMTRTYGNRIDRFDLGAHVVHSRLLPQHYTRPYGITLGSDNQLWFTNQGPTGIAIGKLCPDLSAGQCKGS